MSFQHETSRLSIGKYMQFCDNDKYAISMDVTVAQLVTLPPQSSRLLVHFLSLGYCVWSFTCKFDIFKLKRKPAY